MTQFQQKVLESKKEIIMERLVVLDAIYEYMQEGAGYTVISSYLKDLARNKDITWEDYRYYMDLIIDSGYFNSGFDIKGVRQ